MVLHFLRERTGVRQLPIQNKVLTRTKSTGTLVLNVLDFRTVRSNCPFGL